MKAEAEEGICGACLSCDWAEVMEDVRGEGNDMYDEKAGDGCLTLETVG